MASKINGWLRQPMPPHDLALDALYDKVYRKDVLAYA